MKTPTLVLALTMAATSANAQAAPRVATTLPAHQLSALETIRKNVWVDWFSGDTAALRRALGPELVAISPDGAHWQSLEQTIAGSARFKERGGRFISVAFDSTLVHRFGDVIVMFSHYAVEMESGGKPVTQKGRATEVFVRHNDQWVHTSWHLDVVGD